MAFWPKGLYFRLDALHKGGPKMPQEYLKKIRPRRPRDVPPKFAYLLDDPNVARWHRYSG